MIILGINLMLDITYFFKTTFAGKGIYAFYCALLLIRILISVGTFARFFTIKFVDDNKDNNKISDEDYPTIKK